MSGKVERSAPILELARRRASEAEGTFVSVDSNRLTIDGWANSLTGVGMAQRDKRMTAVFSRARVLSQPELDALFAGDWLIARACERPAADQVRRWVDIKVDGKKGSDDDIAQAMDELDVKARVQEAITWARLHGGALIVMGVEDGGEPHEAVNVERIKGITWLNVIDRWDATVYSYYADQGQAQYGVPAIYQMATTIVSPDGSMLGSKFHETRCLRFEGVLTSRRARLENAGWNHGIVQRLYDAVRDFHSAIAGAAHLTTDFAQAVIKIKGLAKMLLEDKDELVTARLLALDMARSMVRVVPLDEDESLERMQTPVSGLPELLDRLRDVICGAVDIPEKILFGKATAGLGDQGQSDLEQYYNQIAGEQDRNLKPQVGRLAEYLYAARGRAPKRWRVEPRPLWEPTDSEVSENRKRDAETDSLNITSGLYSAEEARKSRFSGDGYGRDIVIEQDDDELDAIASAEEEGPEEVKEVTGIVINAAAQVVKDLLAGDITEPAARIIIKAALRLEDKDIDAMFEGVEEERERRKAEAAEMAAKIAEGGGAVDPETGKPMPPKPGQGPAAKPPPKSPKEE